GHADHLAGRHRERVDEVAAESGHDVLEVDLRVVAVLVERALRVVDLAGAHVALHEHVGRVAALGDAAALPLDLRHARLDVLELLDALQQPLDRRQRAQQGLQPIHRLLAEYDLTLTAEHLDRNLLANVAHRTFSLVNTQTNPHPPPESAE